MTQIMSLLFLAPDIPIGAAIPSKVVSPQSVGIDSLKALPNESGCLNRNVTEIPCLQKRRSNFRDFCDAL